VRVGVLGRRGDACAGVGVRLGVALLGVGEREGGVAVPLDEGRRGCTGVAVLPLDSGLRVGCASLGRRAGACGCAVGCRVGWAWLGRRSGACGCAVGSRVGTAVLGLVLRRGVTVR